METEEREASFHGSLITGNVSKEEELSFQMSTFNEAMTQIRELEEGHGRAQGYTARARLA